MVTYAQPVVSLAPSAPISLSIVNGGPGQLAMTTGGSAGAVTSVNGQTGAVTLTGLPPDGAAGGVLAGTYPSPSRIAYPATALTDAATIAIDASQGNRFTVTLGGNRTLGTPTSPLDGQPLILEVKQDATGSRTLAYSPAYEFGTGLASPTLSTAAGDVDLLGFIYSAAISKWRFVAFTGGFSS